MQRQQTTDPNAAVIEASLAGLPRYMTRGEVADLLRCKPDFISKLVRCGDLIAVQRRVQRGVPMKIPRGSVQMYLQRCAR